MRFWALRFHSTLGKNCQQIHWDKSRKTAVVAPRLKVMAGAYLCDTPEGSKGSAPSQAQAVSMPGQLGGTAVTVWVGGCCPWVSRV